MENYGFVLVTKTEAEQEYHLPNSMGSFQELFRLMQSEISTSLNHTTSSPSMPGKKHEYGLAPQMNDSYHGSISFLNNYFIFKKDRQVDAKSISEAFIKNRGLHEALQEHLTLAVSDIVPMDDASASAKGVKKAKKAKTTAIITFPMLLMSPRAERRMT
jgi:hypothetical protein